LEIKENVPSEIETPKKANSIRVHYNEKEIIIDFGHATKMDENNILAVDVLARISVPPELIKQIVTRLLLAGKKYQDEFNTSIGLNIEEHKASSNRGE